MADTLVHAGTVVLAAAQDGKVEWVREGAVAVTDGFVVDVGSYASVRDRHPAATEVGSSHHIALPGLVDGHHHVGLTPTQLGVPSESLELWTHMLAATRPVDPYLDTLVSGFELLRSGVTTVQHLSGVRDYTDTAGADGADDAVLQAYSDLGMRVSYSVGIVDQNRLFHGDEANAVAGLPEPYATQVTSWLDARPSAASQLDRGYHGLRSRWQGGADDRIRIQLAPTNLHWCSDEALSLVGKASAEDDTPMHMHLLETPYQRAYGFTRSTGGAVGHLEVLGLLGPRLTIGHGVHVDDADLDLLAERGVSLCHNPSSNLRLKSGTAPLNDYLARGINIALGIDEAGIADDRDMLLELKLALNLHRPPGIDSPVPTSAAVLAMATSGGARTTPFGDEIGRLRPGSRADLVLVDRRRLAGAYLSDEVPVADALVQRGRPEHLDVVMVGGKIVVDRGRVTTVTEEDVLIEIAEQMARPWVGREAALRQRDVLLKAARRHYHSWLD